MLDPEEVAIYEAWKQVKLVSETDLSIHAYNTEMEAVALAWEAGVDAAFAGAIIRQNAKEVKASNPYRGKGMRGERKITS